MENLFAFFAGIAFFSRAKQSFLPAGEEGVASVSEQRPGGVEGSFLPYSYLFRPLFVFGML